MFAELSPNIVWTQPYTSLYKVGKPRLVSKKEIRTKRNTDRKKYGQKEIQTERNTDRTKHGMN